MSRKKQTLVMISVVILISNISIASGWKEDAQAIDVSGGEDHTLVLTKNKCAWACGHNYWYQLGIGDTQELQKTLVRVLGGDMGTLYLQDINDIDAGWTHSLALDVNGLVWGWGWNSEGQLGVGDKDLRSTPVQVHGVSDVGFLENITGISAGRSGMQYLAVDANNLVYGWGYNMYGQCGSSYWQEVPESGIICAL